ncbi:MAG: hypothetical protein K0R00_86 [Herbinix sp.]|jgi:TusA-related sulfurtransferase|nr:hypothetical protein [Herbinix sp.]
MNKKEYIFLVKDVEAEYQNHVILTTDVEKAMLNFCQEMPNYSYGRQLEVWCDNECIIHQLKYVASQIGRISELLRTTLEEDSPELLDIMLGYLLKEKARYEDSQRLAKEAEEQRQREIDLRQLEALKEKYPDQFLRQISKRFNF